MCFFFHIKLRNSGDIFIAPCVYIIGTNGFRSTQGGMHDCVQISLTHRVHLSPYYAFVSGVYQYIRTRDVHVYRRTIKVDSLYDTVQDRYKSPRRQRKEEKGRRKPIVVVVVVTIIITSTGLCIIRRRMVAIGTYGVV